MEYKVWSGVVLIATFKELESAIHFCINCYDVESTRDIKITATISTDPPFEETVFKCNCDSIMVIKRMLPPEKKYLRPMSDKGILEMEKFFKQALSST
jgi:hypothetical protein